MKVQMAPRTVRRLVAADGFLDLGMPDRAIAELELIEDAGILEGPKQLLLGVAMKKCQQFSTAIQHLEKAARLMPSPVRRFAWKELTDCYQAVGSVKLAAMAEQLAGDGDWDLQITLPNTSLVLNVLKSARTTDAVV